MSKCVVVRTLNTFDNYIVVRDQSFYYILGKNNKTFFIDQNPIFANLEKNFEILNGNNVVDSVNKNQLTAYVKESNIDSAALLKAFDQIHEALQNAKSDLEKAGLIQYFKFTFELEW